MGNQSEIIMAVRYQPFMGRFLLGSRGTLIAYEKPDP